MPVTSFGQLQGVEFATAERNPALLGFRVLEAVGTGLEGDRKRSLIETRGPG